MNIMNLVEQTSNEPLTGKNTVSIVFFTTASIVNLVYQAPRCIWSF